MKKNLVLVVVLFLQCFVFTNARATVNCGLVEIIGSHMSREIVDQMNHSIAGSQYRISKRKTLVLKSVNSVSFSGCTVTAKVKAKLKRKIRRDAVGTITLKAKVASFNRDQVCLKNAKVTKINLSHTLGLGEAVYQWAANKTIPNYSCYAI